MKAADSETLTRRLHRFFRAAIARQNNPDSYAVFLGGTPGPSALNRWSLIGLNAERTLELTGNRLTITRAGQPPETHLIQTSEDLLTHCRRFQSACPVRSPHTPDPDIRAPEDLPFRGGLVGMAGYEAARWMTSGCNASAPDRDAGGDAPDLLLIACRDWLVADLHCENVTLLSADDDSQTKLIDLWRESLPCADDALVTTDGNPLPGFEQSLNDATFAEAVDRIQEHIRQGNVYQANLAVRFEQQLPLDLLNLYETLCHQNPSPFSAFISWPDGALVCNSPERLVRTTPEGRAETRPIAGTRGRGDATTDDEAVGALLRGNEKEKAEHLMLVDLERNDLGRVCRAGSVTVDELLTLERYSHVTHLVSNIQGALNPDTDAWDVLRAMFPGGTITGCPKLRCMEILAGAEPVRRGLYTGSVFWIDAATGAMDSNIIIRSLQCRRMKPADPTEPRTETGYNGAWRVSLHAGAGIVADSLAPHEYHECHRKAAAMMTALRLAVQPENLPPVLTPH